MRRSLAIAIPIWLLATSLLACRGSKSSGAPSQPKIIYLPSSATECLTQPPPPRPTLIPCRPDQPQCAEANLASLLDYLTAVDRYARLAWSVCGVKPLPQGDPA